MKKTIQELRNKLFSKEILSEHDLLRLRGGDGEEDKRKEIGGGTSNMNSNFGGNGNGKGNAGGVSTTGNNPGGG
jgi:hypothetical protein